MKRLAALLVVSLALLSACARRADVKDWLADAEAAHRNADRRLPAGDVNGARTALSEAAKAPAPPAASSRDARVVRQDLYYRLATLEVEHGTPEEAVRVATAGLVLGEAKDVFTANLEIVRGKAHELLGDAIAASRDYHAALLVTEALLDESLEGARKTP